MNMNYRFHVAKCTLLLLALIFPEGFLSCGASRTNPPGIVPGNIQVQGSQYPYAVFVPSTYDHVHVLPAILLVHGGGGNGPDFLKIWQDFAEKNGINPSSSDSATRRRSRGASATTVSGSDGFSENPMED
jgi:poly(3-hydroxybutyrate) depolymerase